MRREPDGPRRMAEPLPPDQLPADQLRAEEPQDPTQSAPRMAEPELIPSLGAEPSLGGEPILDAEPALTDAPWDLDAPPTEPEAINVPQSVIELGPVSEPEAVLEPEPATPDAKAPRPEPSAAVYPQTVRDLLERVDTGWVQFRAAVGAFPIERMDEHLFEEGWTRKQMLAHIAAWHDLTTDRLNTMLGTGSYAPLVEQTDAINARAARKAVGKTAGEVVKDMEATFNRLRRHISTLTDQNLAAEDGWAARIVAGNTYVHYEEHAADVFQPPAPDNRAGRR